MSTRKRHTVCKAGAAVRLHGYAPARVLAVFVRAGESGVWAECRITARGPDWKAGQVGPHGYRPGQLVYVRAGDAVPRDIIRVSRQRMGALVWPSFDIRTTGEYLDTPPSVSSGNALAALLAAHSADPLATSELHALAARLRGDA